MEIKCLYDELVPPTSLIPHPKNRNQHPPDQITRLSNIIKYQGVRAPIVVSKLSGYIVKGHGTLLAETEAGLKQVPVVYQDFENEDQEYLFLQSDNAIAEWSTLDFSGINLDIPDLGPIDIDLLGIKNFSIDPSEKTDPSKEWEGMPEFNQADKTSYRHVVIHFDDQDAAAEFFRLIGHEDTGQTRSLWYPPKENMDTESKRY